MTPIKIGEKTVYWEWAIHHCAKVVVTRTSVFPYLWSADIYSNGSLQASCQLCDFGISELDKVAQGPIPEGGIVDGYTMRYYLSIGYGATPIEIIYKLPLGDNTRALSGTLRVTAVCDVMYEQIDEGEHGWKLSSDEIPVVEGPLYDTPNNTRTRVYLKTNAAATYQLITNSNTYSGKIGLSNGVVLDNTLWAYAKVDCKALTDTASGLITVSHSLGSFTSTGTTHSWVDGSTASCSGAQATGSVEAVATCSDGFETHAVMSCRWNLQRQAELKCFIADQSGAGIDADLYIGRYTDDELPTKESCSGGSYDESIIQKGYSWGWSATHHGNSAPGPSSGTYYNWGNAKVALDATWNESEQRKLPDEWSSNNSSYLSHRDGTVHIHMFNFDDVVSIYQAQNHVPKIGYNTGNYTASGNMLYSYGNADTGSQVGIWSVNNSATIELDNTLHRILVKPASSDCVAKRTLILDASQAGSSPSLPARDAWTGYRWLQIILEPADASTGAPIETVGDTITIEIDQDDFAAHYDEPDVQTWASALNKTKRYTAITQRGDGVTYIDIDLAKPISPAKAIDGENPPCVENYGDTSVPNVLSHYPHPTLDAAHGGITNACELRITLPHGKWWRIGDFSLHHKLGAEPVLSLMPAYNQWIRQDRRDKINDDDYAEAKVWLRRLIAVDCEGLLGAEAMDIKRTSSMSTETMLHSFSYNPLSVLTVIEQLTNITQIKHFPSGANAGAIRQYPGMAYSISLPEAGYDVDIVDHLMSVACNMGGRGITWVGENRIVWGNKALVDNKWAVMLQGLTNAVDWFGGCGDVFRVEDSELTGPIHIRACTVLRGSVNALASKSRTYALVEIDRPTPTPSTIQTGVSPNAYEALRLVGGKAKLSHDVTPSSSASKAEFTGAHTISWNLDTDTIIEAPSWWEQRGCYRCLLIGATGAQRPRYRASDGKPLCQKSGLGRTHEGRCVFCPHGL